MNFEKPDAEQPDKPTRFKVGDTVKVPKRYIHHMAKRREPDGSLVPQRAEDWEIMGIELKPEHGEPPYAIVIENTGLRVATSIHIPLDELEEANPKKS